MRLGAVVSRRVVMGVVGLVLCLVPNAQADETPAGLVRALDHRSTVTALDAASEKAQFLLLLNAYRQSQGLAGLELNSCLQTAGQWMSTDMAEKNYFSHTDSLGRSASERMRNFGYTAPTYTGENIAAGYATAADVLQGWKLSAGHNANMLSPNYRVIGIGLAYSVSSTYGWYWTTDFGGLQTDPAPPGTITTPAPVAECRVRVYPCPAREDVRFSWSVPAMTQVRIQIFAASGERVARLQTEQAGESALMWRIGPCSTGIYFYACDFWQAGVPVGQTSGKLAVIR